MSAQVVAEPLDTGPGRQHHGFDAPRRLPLALPGHDRKGAGLAPGRRAAADGWLTGALVEHAAGAEGGLGQTRAGCSPDR